MAKRLARRYRRKKRPRLGELIDLTISGAGEKSRWARGAVDQKGLTTARMTMKTIINAGTSFMIR